MRWPTVLDCLPLAIENWVSLASDTRNSMGSAPELMTCSAALRPAS